MLSIKFSKQTHTRVRVCTHTHTPTHKHTCTFTHIHPSQTLQWPPQPPHPQQAQIHNHTPNRHKCIYTITPPTGTNAYKQSVIEIPLVKFVKNILYSIGVIHVWRIHHHHHYHHLSLNHEGHWGTTDGFANQSIHIEYKETQICHSETIWKQIHTLLEKEKRKHIETSSVQLNYYTIQTRTIFYS